MQCGNDVDMPGYIQMSSRIFKRCEKNLPRGRVAPLLDADDADVAAFDECLVSECLSRLNATLVYCPYWCPSGLVEM